MLRIATPGSHPSCAHHGVGKLSSSFLQPSDGKGFQLLSEEQKQEVDQAKRFEAMGLLHFSEDEEDELSLETIISDKSKGWNKSQGSKKPIVKPKPKQPVAPKLPVKPKQPITPNQPSNIMARTVSNQVMEGEMTPFHKDALSSAGGLTTPANKGSSLGGWITKGAGKRTPNVCDIFSPKNVGNMLGMRDLTPPNSDSDNGSAGSNKSNRYAVLQDNQFIIWNMNTNLSLLKKNCWVGGWDPLTTPVMPSAPTFLQQTTLLFLDPFCAQRMTTLCTKTSDRVVGRCCSRITLLKNLPILLFQRRITCQQKLTHSPFSIMNLFITLAPMATEPR